MCTISCHSQSPRVLPLPRKCTCREYHEDLSQQLLRRQQDANGAVKAAKLSNAAKAHKYGPDLSISDTLAGITAIAEMICRQVQVERGALRAVHFQSSEHELDEILEFVRGMLAAITFPQMFGPQRKPCSVAYFGEL